MKSSFTFTRTRIIAVLLTLCAVGIFAIAGTWYTNAQKSQNTKTGSNSQPTPTPTAQQTPPSTTCGTVSTRPGEPTIVLNGQDAATAETCFWEAYQQCQTKTLTLHQMGVDAGVDTTLWPTMQNNKCVIAGLVNNYIVPHTNHKTSITCTTMQKTQQGLDVSECGTHPDIIVPAPTQTS